MSGFGVYDTFKAVAGMLYQELKERLESGDVIATQGADAEEGARPALPGSQGEDVNSAIDSALRETGVAPTRVEPHVPAMPAPAPESSPVAPPGTPPAAPSPSGWPAPPVQQTPAPPARPAQPFQNATPDQAPPSKPASPAAPSWAAPIVPPAGVDAEAGQKPSARPEEEQWADPAPPPPEGIPVPVQGPPK
jgi:hypothetical protein